jgi:hypothetical protein
MIHPVRSDLRACAARPGKYYLKENEIAANLGAPRAEFQLQPAR